MPGYTVKHQCDNICSECWCYFVDGKTDVEYCIKDHNDRVGRHVLACEDFEPDQI